METLEYVTRARHLWWIVLVPLVAAAAAGVWVLQQPPTWTGTATVQPVITGASGQAASSGVDADEYVAAFTALATGTPLLTRVADETGVPLRRLVADVEVARDGESTALDVRFSSSDRDAVEPVLRAVTRLVLEDVFQGEVEQAEAAVARAQEQVQAADAALTEFGTRTGVADPAEAYQAVLNQVNGIDARRVAALGADDTTGAEQFGAEAERLRATFPTYVPLLTEHDRLSADRAAAQDRLDRARERQDEAIGLVAAAAPEQVVFVTGPVQQDVLLDLARTALAAAAVALVLCLLLASVLGSLARSRAVSRRNRRAVRDEDEDAAAGPDAVAGRDREPVRG